MARKSPTTSSSSGGSRRGVRSEKAPSYSGSALTRIFSRGGRRAAIAVAVLVTLGAAGIAWWLEPARSRPGDGPIILISIDTLRADHLPAYGYRKLDTPAVDALAREGVVFDHAYAHSPQTLPSHASILSGELPFQTGVRDNVGFTLGKAIPWLPDLLRARGFATAGVVSAFVLRKETGVDRGFDFFDGRMPPAAPDKPMGQVQRDGAESLTVAERWMDARQTPRFFLFLHLYEPHKPYDPPARFARYAPYDGEIAYADEIVGRLVGYLQRKSWYDRATIILLSDHGEGLGDHGEQEHGLFLYTETIRVPLIVRLPDAARGGRRIETPVQHIDLVPTILDWVGAARPNELRGRSLAALLGGSSTTLPDAELYAESLFGRYHFGWSDLYALTDARYRFIRAPHPELYDLERDPNERRNVAGERQQTASAMRGVLDRVLAGVNVHAQERVSKDDLARLQALGYVGQTMVPANAPSDSLPDPKDKIAVLETYRRAIELADLREYDESTRLMHAVLQDNPTMKDGWLQLGVQLVRAGRTEEALAAFRRMVELDPADANSFVSAAGVLLTLGRREEAAANATIGLEKAGSDSRATTSACEVLVKVALANHDDAAARQYAQMAEKADAAFPLPSYVEGLLLHREKRFEQALPFFMETAKRLEGQNFAIPELYYYIGDTFGNLGQEREAAAAFEQETRLFPAEINPRTHLAALLRAAGRNDDASRVLDGLLEAVPTPEGYRSAAEMWAIFGETARAEAVRAQAGRRFGKRAVLPANGRSNAR